VEIPSAVAVNFGFVDLGMTPLTSAPDRENVKIGPRYVPPVFIIVSTIAIIVTGYAAVFPLATTIINFHPLQQARTTRGDELAAGFKGGNVHMFAIQVLIVLVVTVVVFGGTTAKMLEVLGIRTGVADEDGRESDEEEGLKPIRRLLD
jgi:solute carrier family 9 (sodium/hydrogen exchanger), member 6/7